MEVKMVLILVFALATATVWTGGVRAQTSGCTSVLMSMASCLNYVTGSSSTPSTSCCSKLASVVQSQPQCLCSALDGSAGSALGITVNRTIALGLPAACDVKTPPVSRCDQAGSPATSPVGSPEATPPETSGDLAPDSSRGSSISGSKAGPSNGLTSGSSTSNTKKKSVLQLITFILVLASYVST